jgi:hypothetical protein
LPSIVTAATRRGARAVLLIDEAQSLPADCHAEIAWLLEALDGLAVILAGDDDVVAWRERRLVHSMRPPRR